MAAHNFYWTCSCGSELSDTILTCHCGKQRRSDSKNDCKHELAVNGQCSVCKRDLKCLRLLLIGQGGHVTMCKCWQPGTP